MFCGFVCSLYLTDIVECVPCPGGHFCATPGLTHPSGLCEAGYYCLGGDTTATGTIYENIEWLLFFISGWHKPRHIQT